MSSYYEQKSVEEEAMEAVRQHAEAALNEGDTAPRRLSKAILELFRTCFTLVLKEVRRRIEGK